jgi:hypothetical protein
VTKIEKGDKISLEGVKDGTENGTYTFTTETVYGIGPGVPSTKRAVISRQRCEVLSGRRSCKMEKNFEITGVNLVALETDFNKFLQTGTSTTYFTKR